MRILVTGAAGQLGSDVVKAMSAQGDVCIGTSSSQLDITDKAAVLRLMTDIRPEAVIHCAAWTKVDLAEDEPERCFAVNAVGTENIALACREISAKMMYISTDYVFDGKGTDFYETDSPVSPINTYGKSKLAGEQAVQSLLNNYFILRTSWAFGHNGDNFIKKILNLAEQRKEIAVVDDQIGSPTYTVDLAELICKIVRTDRYGVYHSANEGVCSWADLAERALELYGMDAKVKRVDSRHYPTTAKRPLNSRLSMRSLDEGGFSRLPTWQDALIRYIEKEKTEGR